MAALPIADDSQLALLENISTTATKLQNDIYCFIQRTTAERARFEAKAITLPEISFWFKCITHSTLAFAEGLCHEIRIALKIYHKNLELEIDARKLAKMVDLDKNLPLKENLSLSFRILPRLFGVTFQLDTSGADYRAFLALIEARDKFTHPKSPAAIYPFDLLAAMNSGIEWLLLAWKELLVACAQKFRGSADAPASRQFPFRDQRLQEFRDFGREYAASQVSDDFFGTLSPMVFGLMDDTSRALGIATIKEAGEPRIPPDVALRNLVRFVFSEIEGTTFIAAAFLYRYGFTDQLPTKDLMIGAHQAVRERVVKTLECFSRYFGNDTTVRRQGVGWESFCAARDLRNRLMHPKNHSDVELKSQELDQLMRLLDWWHREVHDCLTVTGDERKQLKIIAAERSGLRSID